MMDTRTVYGYVRRMDGTPASGVPVSIRTFPGVFQVDGSVAPEVHLDPTTDAAGRYETSLVTNARYLIGIPGDVFAIIVPSGVGSVSVEALRATTGVVMTNTFQMLLDAALLLKENALGNPDVVGKFLTSTVGGLRSWALPPSGGVAGIAGGVLSGNYPNPGFAADMATQAELDAHIAAITDVHTQYQKESERGAASGYASLGAGATHPLVEMGTNIAGITAGEEAYFFVNALGAWADRTVLNLLARATTPAAAANVQKLYGTLINGIMSVRTVSPTGLETDLLRDTSFIARNETAAIITKGKPVYMVGVFTGSGVVPTIGMAKSDANATMPCVGITLQDIPINGFGRVMTEGRIDNLNTSAFLNADRLWVSPVTAGAFVNARPAHPNLDHRVGMVLRSHASVGSVFVNLPSMLGEGLGSNAATFSLGPSATQKASLSTTGITAARTHTLPNVSGTLALLSDVGGLPEAARYIGGVGEPAFTGSVWSNYDATNFENLHFWLDRGVVTIAGTIKANAGVQDGVMWVMPLGYRPAKTVTRSLFAAVFSGNLPLTTFVQSNGNVVFKGTSGDYQYGWTVFMQYRVS